MLSACSYKHTHQHSFYFIDEYCLGVDTLNPCPAEPGYTLPMQAEEANWSGSALFAIKYVNLYQQSGSSNLISWKLEMGMAS